MNHGPVSSPQRALLIGTPAQLERLEQQLDLMQARPTTIGWLRAGEDGSPGDRRFLGEAQDLDRIVRREKPDLAIVTLPAVMHDLVTHLRTQLRRLGVPDRFVPTLEDLVEGIGPRTHVDIDCDRLLGRSPRVLNPATIATVIAGRRIAITGAGGSIGSELCRIVAAHGPAQLIMIERSENALFEIDRQIARRFPRVARRVVLHDIVDAAGTAEHFAALKPQVVFHTAAHKHVPMMEMHPAAAIDNNLFGTRSVADAADAAGCERFVMISTDKAVNPVSIMGATKRLAEQYVQTVAGRTSMRCSMVRFGNVLGSAGSVLEIWQREIADGGPISVTDPRMTRYFMTIPEAAALVIESAALLDPGGSGAEVFLLDMGEPVRIVDLACRFAEAYGLAPVLPAEDEVVPPQPSPGSIRLVFTGARPGEKLFEELAFDAEHMLPTRHPSITTWHVPAPSADAVERALAALSPDQRGSDPRLIAAAVRRAVPEMRTPITSGSA